MRRIRSRDTSPELTVRRIVHGLGYRYRLHRKNLPGRPDLVFVSRRKVIFVHGCFWHRHEAALCSDSRLPQSNASYWTPKLNANVERDARHIAALEADEWRVLVLWDCELKDERAIVRRLRKFLGRH